MSDQRIQLAAHPRASRHIAKAKGWGGLIGFVLVGWLSMRAHVPAFEAGVRALAGGVGLYLLGWFAALAIWREVAVAEVALARRRAHEAALARAEAESARAAQASAAGA